MIKFEKPEIEIIYFDCKDIITTSDHDNWFSGSGSIPYIIRDAIDKIL